MGDDPIKAAEARGYAKGYAAGQRRADRADERDEIRGRRDRFRHDLFIAILPSIIARPWGREIDGTFVADKGADQITATAWTIVNAAAKQVSFS